MREPRFWWQPRSLAAHLLAPVAALYGAVAAARMRRAGRAAGIPVVCVGNLTLGGAGKTPAALAIARLLAGEGERPFLLSRGYGGTLAGPLRVDAGTHSAREVGDEPLLLARAAPTVVARDRVAGAAAARAGGATVIVMDDGLQNPALAKDFTIAVIDGRRGLGNGAMFPAGPLRAPLVAQLAATDALLVIGTGKGAAEADGIASAHGLPVFHARLDPDRTALSDLAGKRVLAFAGIGDPEKFFATLAYAGINAPVREAFADHHRYTRTDAARLLARAERDGLHLVTTEKDLARMAGDAGLAALAIAAHSLPVTLVFHDESAFRALLFGKIAKR
jgi:tetraacyldisaccharide 4'-kinase